MPCEKNFQSYCSPSRLSQVRFGSEGKFSMLDKPILNDNEGGGWITAFCKRMAVRADFRLIRKLRNFTEI